MLRYLMGDEKAFETPDILKVNTDPNAFEYLEDELHYVIAIVYDRKAATLSDLKYRSLTSIKSIFKTTI
ncbi:MAG: hypothetical protein IPF93_14890 [Saprospiraceae bacterium]|nr:hypothetical protein [Saprospiraceae bacterium]